MSSKGFFIVNEKLDSMSGESIRIYRHYSGFSLTHIPKHGYHTRTLAVGITGGLNHLHFLDPESGGDVVVPEGTPRALQHMILSNQESGQSVELEAARTGAVFQRYIGYDLTVFYLESGGDLIAPARKLLHAILRPLQIREAFKLQKDALRAELNLPAEDVDVLRARALNRLLYPAGGYIPGHVESALKLETLTPEDLEAFRRAFYVPSNLRIVAVGDYSEDALLEMVAEAIEPRIHETHAQVLLRPPNALTADKTRYETYSSLEPSFHLGFLDRRRHDRSFLHGTEYFLHLRAGEIGMELLLGEGSKLYEELRSEAWIDDRFETRFISEIDLAYATISGYHPEPEKAAERVAIGLQEAVRAGLDREDFMLKKNGVIGDLLRAVDRLKEMTLLSLRCAVLGFDIYDYSRILRRLELEQVEEAVSFISEEENRRRATIYFMPPSMPLR